MSHLDDLRVKAVAREIAVLVGGPSGKFLKANEDRINRIARQALAAADAVKVEVDDCRGAPDGVRCGACTVCIEMASDHSAQQHSIADTAAVISAHLPVMDGETGKSRCAAGDQESWHEYSEHLAVVLVREGFISVDYNQIERALEDVLAQRDQYHEIADSLAYAIAPMEEIGEHSSSNDPWENALEVARGRTRDAQANSVRTHAAATADPREVEKVFGEAWGEALMAATEMSFTDDDGNPIGRLAGGQGHFLAGWMVLRPLVADLAAHQEIAGSSVSPEALHRAVERVLGMCLMAEHYEKSGARPRLLTAEIRRAVEDELGLILMTGP